MADRVTRPSNATAHPGMVDRNPMRRSREEIAAEKQAKAMAKARAETEKRDNIAKVVALERAEIQRAMDMDREADDPVEPFMQAKTRKTRKRPENTEDSKWQG